MLYKTGVILKYKDILQTEKIFWVSLFIVIIIGFAVVTIFNPFFDNPIGLSILAVTTGVIAYCSKNICKEYNDFLLSNDID